MISQDQLMKVSCDILGGTPSQQVTTLPSLIVNIGEVWWWWWTLWAGACFEWERICNQSYEIVFICDKQSKQVNWHITDFWKNYLTEKNVLLMWFLELHKYFDTHAQDKFIVNSQLSQFVVFKTLSYFFEGTIEFDVKASFASRPVLRLIRWYNKPADIIN